MFLRLRDESVPPARTLLASVKRAHILLVGSR